VRAEFRAATDEELSARIAERPSDEACTELFRRYNKRIYLWCFNYTHDAEEAVDLAQEIFIKLFRNIGSFSGRSRFSTWAYQVTRNHCLGELAKKGTQWRRRMLSADDEESGMQLTGANPFEALDLEEDLERILEAAGGIMKEDELGAFVLHYYEGMTVNEITKILGCENITGARTLIQNARRKFQRLIEEKGYGDE
jgi:RNA polymerase sigma-70 factor (ECF subfamily)